VIDMGVGVTPQVLRYFVICGTMFNSIILILYDDDTLEVGWALDLVHK
jgi:hypothetical protein